MGHWVEIQVKFDWDADAIPRAGGSVAGKAVANLLELLYTYCYDPGADEPDKEIRAWFTQLDHHYRGRLSDLGKYLGLEQNYADGDEDPSMKGFFHTAWVQTETLLEHLLALREAIHSAQLESKWWFEPDSTDKDIRGLVRSLNLILRLGGRTVRLFIS